MIARTPSVHTLTGPFAAVPSALITASWFRTARSSSAGRSQAASTTTRTPAAILTAARMLLVRDGPAGVTHQRVAAEAGVGRATVYRHWPRPEQLLLDVMAGVDLPFFREPTVPVRPWLAKQLHRLADE